MTHEYLSRAIGQNRAKVAGNLKSPTVLELEEDQLCGCTVCSSLCEGQLKVWPPLSSSYTTPVYLTSGHVRWVSTDWEVIVEGQKCSNTGSARWNEEKPHYPTRDKVQVTMHLTYSTFFSHTTHLNYKYNIKITSCIATERCRNFTSWT